MNKFRNFFRHKSTRKEDDLSRFMSFHEKVNDENRRPTKSGKGKVDPRDANATACYHTETAPKTRRGPKSCPGGYKDEVDGGIVNRSFETEVAPRRRERDRMSEFGRESQRQKRVGRALSEYGADVPSSKMSHFSYRPSLRRDEMTETDEDNDEHDSGSLKRENTRLLSKLRYSEARHSYYKQEYKMLLKTKHEAEQAFTNQIENYKRQVEELKQKNQMLNNSLKSLHNQNQQLRCGPFSTGSGNGGFLAPYPYSLNSRPTFGTAPELFPTSNTENTGSIVADPQPTRNDLCSMPPLSFPDDDRDETKNFRCRESYSSIQTADHSITSMGLLNQALNEL